MKADNTEYLTPPEDPEDMDYAKTTNTPKSQKQPMRIGLRLRAECRQIEPGIAEITIEGSQISPEDHARLVKLFPKLYGNVISMLDDEAVLAAILPG